MIFLLLLLIPIVIAARNAQGNKLKRKAEWLAHENPVGMSRAAIEASLGAQAKQVFPLDIGGYGAIYAAPRFIFSLIFDANDRCTGFSKAPGSFVDKTYNPVISAPHKFAPDPTNPEKKFFHRRPRFDPNFYTNPQPDPHREAREAIEQVLDNPKYKPLRARPIPRDFDLKPPPRPDV
jgi:hypothetical protein